MAGVLLARRGLILVVMSLVALSACEERSRVDPDAEVSIRGTVMAPDDTPLADRPVRIGLGVGSGDGAIGVLTLGLSCTDGSCTGDVFDTETDGAGNYSFTLKGRDTQSSFGEARSVLFSASAAPGEGEVSGARVAARFRVQTSEVQLPLLQLVDPGLALTGGSNVDAKWEPARPGPYDLTFEEAEVIPVWKVTTADPGVAVDGRLLEDAAGRAVVAGGWEDRVEGSSLAVTWRSPGIAFAGAAGPPPSRGGACRFTSANGASVEERPCDLTDGDLSSSATVPSVCPPGPTPPPETCAPATHVVIDLGRDVPVELVAVRGCEGGCTVAAGQADGSYPVAGSASDDFGTVALDGRPTRSVQIGLGSGTRLREISVWGPAPEQALKDLSQGERDEIGQPFGGGGGGDGVSRWLLVVGAVLAAMALAATFYFLGRRRPVT